MIYQERTLAFRQICEGFSSDGAPVSGIVKAERLGDTLTVRPSPFHLAPLDDGRYACILTDGRATEVFDVARETRRRSPLELGGALCALLCFVGAVVSPVAIAQSGDIRCKPEELAQKKESLAEVSIQINDIETEKKEVMDDFKERLKPLNEEKAELLDHIKKGSEFRDDEECVKILYHDERMAGFYNRLGELVYSRPIMPQEMQKTMFSINRKTGTDD